MKSNIKRFIIFFIILGAALSLSLEKTQIIEITDSQNHILKELYPENQEFTLSYIHSVLLTPADEIFTISEGSMKLVKTVYESFGVGLPYSQEKDSDFEIIDGKFILYRDRNFENIGMVISPIPQHKIKVNDMEYDLYEITGHEEMSIDIHTKEKYIVKIGNIIIPISISSLGNASVPYGTIE
jgi:hypothetical protein